MPKWSFLLFFVLLLLGCGEPPAPETITPTREIEGGVTPAETSASPRLPSPLATPVLTPTAFVEGLTTRLGTPDPSPNCPQRYPWFFENRAVECADTVLQTWASLQRFEHGLMVWFQEGGRTYVLVDDLSLFKPYRELSDFGLPYLPDPDPDLITPPGFFQPDLGFAKFWRGIVPGSEEVRAQLGWAVAPEQGYGALWQCNLSSADEARCYFTGPDDEIIALARGASRYWNYQQGAVR